MFFHTYDTPLQYADNEEVVVWMNTVGPYHNRQETYPYFSLPFCKGTKKEIGHYHETMGEALQGVELEFSGLHVGFKGETLFRHAQSCWSLNVTCNHTLCAYLYSTVHK